MRLGEWVLALFCLGGIMVCAGAFAATWWVFVPGVVIFLGAFVLTTWERQAEESDWRWPRPRSGPRR